MRTAVPSGCLTAHSGRRAVNEPAAVRGGPGVTQLTEMPQYRVQREYGGRHLSRFLLLLTYTAGIAGCCPGPHCNDPFRPNEEARHQAFVENLNLWVGRKFNHTCVEEGVEPTESEPTDAPSLACCRRAGHSAGQPRTQSGNSAFTRTGALSFSALPMRSIASAHQYGIAVRRADDRNTIRLMLNRHSRRVSAAGQKSTLPSFLILLQHLDRLGSSQRSRPLRKCGMGR